MPETTDLPELIVLAGDMALHWGLALASTTHGLIDSCHYDAGRIETGKGDQFNESKRRIVAWVKERIDGPIDAAWFEQVTPVSYPTAMAQGGMIGVFQQAAADLGAVGNCPSEYPSRLKKWATKRGHAKKHEMVEAANRFAIEAEYPDRIVNDNEADAVCLAMYAAQQEKAKQHKRLLRRLRLEAEAAK